MVTQGTVLCVPRPIDIRTCICYTMDETINIVQAPGYWIPSTPEYVDGFFFNTRDGSVCCQAIDIVLLLTRVRRYAQEDT